MPRGVYRPLSSDVEFTFDSMSDCDDGYGYYSGGSSGRSAGWSSGATRVKNWRCIMVFIIFVFVAIIVAIAVSLSLRSKTDEREPEERAAADVVRCSSQEFSCSNGVECVEASDRCNGRLDCSDLSDEQYCEGGCDENLHMFTCGNGRCIKNGWVCDRQIDCTDGSDELNCDNCNSTQYTCHDYTCVDADNPRCDGVIDCQDSSDENGCLSVDPTTGQLLFSYYPVCYDSSVHSASLTSKLCAALNRSAIPAFAAKGDLIPATSTKQLIKINEPLAINSTFELSYGSASDESFCPSHSGTQVSCNECGESTKFIAENLVGGDTVGGSTDWPWFAKVVSGKRGLCGGSLISSRYVLTAAHCVKQYASNPSAIRVTLGSVLFDSPYSHIVSDVFVHPNFNTSGEVFSYDFALLKLYKDTKFSSTVKPVCLPSSTQNFPKSSTCYIMGFGTILKNAVHTSAILQEAKIKLFTRQECEFQYNAERIQFGPDRMCAGYLTGGIDACRGDSGGPLVCYTGRLQRSGGAVSSSQIGVWTQLGITSWGSRCGRPVGGVYADLRAALGWIHGVL